MTGTADDMVSVCMITYNHEKYISQAIEGVLMQKTTFPIELIIGEDCSQDSTRNICLDYQARYPGIIKVLPTEGNKGILKNFSSTLLACSGKYIAICEGDDYWTDPDKLQVQRDYMEKNPEIVLCFHNATIRKESEKSEKIFLNKVKPFYSGSEILKKWTIPTASTLFKNVLPKELPAFMYNGTHGDLPLFLLLSTYGKISCINKNMSVYRVIDGGATQSLFKGIDHNSNHIKQLESMKAFFGSRFKKLLSKRLSDYCLSLSLQYFKTSDKKSGKTMLSKSLKEYPCIILLRPFIFFKIILFIIKP